MSNPHPHEKVIIAYYRGETIQQYNPKTRKWSDWPVYNLQLYQRPPAFSQDMTYRVKPTTVRLDLDTEEIETLWTVLQYVGGDPQTTARHHADSLMSKIDNHISQERKDELAEGDLVDEFPSVTGIRFVKNLP